jgi:hypothetical protein
MGATGARRGPLKAGLWISNLHPALVDAVSEFGRFLFGTGTAFLEKRGFGHSAWSLESWTRA